MRKCRAKKDKETMWEKREEKGFQLQRPHLDERIFSSRDHEPILVSKSLGGEDVTVRAESGVLARGSVVVLKSERKKRNEQEGREGKERWRERAAVSSARPMNDSLRET